MERRELYYLVGLPPEAVERLENVSGALDLTPLEPCLAGLLDRNAAPQAYRRLKELLQGDEDHFQLLYCYLECVRRAFDTYQAKSIPLDVYSDTMRCFPRFLAECRQETGKLAFDRGWWAYRQTSLSIFRIGALEYEFHLHQGENALSVHIPSDADLSPAAVDCSLEQAGRFFRRYYPQYRYETYFCNSWLLSPRLRPFLSRNSNILAFQDRFQILSENPADMEFIQWLFRVPEDTPFPQLPARTSLQRSVKALLLQGGTIGAAYGIMAK